MRRVRPARRARRRRGVRCLRAPAVDADRHPVHARIGEAAHAGTGARRIGIARRQGATIAAGAIVGEQPAVGVSRALPWNIGNAHALGRRPVEAADTQHCVDALRRGIGNAHALARRPMEPANAEGILDALLWRATHLLRTHATRRGADTAALVAADLPVLAGTGPARERICGTADHTMLRAQLPWRTVRTDRTAAEPTRRTRHARAFDFRRASVTRRPGHDLECNH